MNARISTLLAVVALTATTAFAPNAVAQNGRPSSPPGNTTVQVGGEWIQSNGRSRYEGGHWIEITYSRPLLRGRQGIFGEGDEYGQRVNAGAPVWRAGANVSTRLNTEVDLKLGETRIPAGEYSLFIDLKGPTDWTLIVSSWDAQQQYDPNNKTALWGSYGYTPEKDVARLKMNVLAVDVSVEQLTFGFVDVTKNGGTLALWWDDVMATVPIATAD
jgi:hypothetical protein